MPHIVAELGVPMKQPRALNFYSTLLRLNPEIFARSEDACSTPLIACIVVIATAPYLDDSFLPDDGPGLLVDSMIHESKAVEGFDGRFLSLCQLSVRHHVRYIDRVGFAPVQVLEYMVADLGRQTSKSVVWDSGNVVSVRFIVPVDWQYRLTYLGGPVATVSMKKPLGSDIVLDIAMRACPGVAIAADIVQNWGLRGLKRLEKLFHGGWKPNTEIDVANRTLIGEFATRQGRADIRTATLSLITLDFCTDIANNHRKVPCHTNLARRP